MKRVICTIAFINIMLVSSFCQDTLKAVLVKDIKISSSSISYENSSWPRDFTVLPDRLLFLAGSGSNSNFQDLWATDGTGEGTRMIRAENSIDPYNVLDGMTVWGNKIIFTANDGFHGYEPWISDGTPGSARMVEDIRPNGSIDNAVYGSSPGFFKIFKDKAYFQADTRGGKQLFVTDGTSQGTVMLTKTGTGDRNPEGFIEFKDKLFFSCQARLGFAPQMWVTDGTIEGTYEFKVIGNGNNGNLHSLNSATEYNNKLYFSAFIDNTGVELWVSDGTSEGTQLFKDINITPERGSNPHGFTIFKNNLYFIADDGIHGSELWCSNDKSTYMVKDISMNNGAMSYADLYVANDRMYFSVQKEKDGPFELWMSDGTAEGTQQVLADDGNSVEAPQTFVEWEGKLVFVAGLYDKQLWITDGRHTHPVFTNAKSFALQYNTSMVVFKDELYFNAIYDELIGSELYKLMVDTSKIRPILLQQPLSNDICMGDSAYFEVKVSGRPDFRYQWMKNEIPIENATKATYSIANASMEDSGIYSCLIKNSVGEIKSKPAFLGVYDLNALFEVIDSTQQGFYLIKFTGDAPASANYQWDFDEGVIISGTGQGPYHVAWKKSGHKNITLNVIMNGCSSLTNKTAEIIPIGNFSRNTINPIRSMYPNPVKSILTTNFNVSEGEKKVTLIDLFGHVVLEKQTNEKSLVLDLSDRSPGAYFIKVQDDLSSIIKKIIKE